MEKPTFSIDEAIEYIFLYCRSHLEVREFALLQYSEIDRYSELEWQRLREVSRRKLRLLEWGQRYLPNSFRIHIKPDIARILIQDLKSL